MGIVICGKICKDNSASYLRSDVTISSFWSVNSTTSWSPFFRGQIIIGCLLGTFLAIGFSVAGLKFGFLLGLILGLLNIIPYLGTMLGIVTVLPIAHLQSDSSLVLIISCIGIFIIGQLLVDYVLTPKIMGKTTGMGPMLIIFAVFFWGNSTEWLNGNDFGNPTYGILLVFWRLVRDKYLPRITQN